MRSFFPAVYDRVMAPLEQGGFLQIRQDLILHAEGTILEIGSGTGINFALYPPATPVFAIEPDWAMLSQSRDRAGRAQAPVTLIQADAQALPFPPGTFDTVVATLVFCTIPDPGLALAEIRRVLKPGGRALFFEHVRLERPFLGSLQDWLTPVWKHVAGGCHLNRRTFDLVRQAGFRITGARRYYHDIFQAVEATVIAAD